MISRAVGVTQGASSTSFTNNLYTASQGRTLVHPSQHSVGHAPLSPVSAGQLLPGPLEEVGEAGVILEVVLCTGDVAFTDTVLSIQPGHGQLKVGVEVLQNECQQSLGEEEDKMEGTHLNDLFHDFIITQCQYACTVATKIYICPVSLTVIELSPKLCH